MKSQTLTSKDQRLTQNEHNEAEAFDRIAQQFDKASLRTSDWTFSRYRKATCGEPIFDTYPDLVFAFIGRHFLRVNEPRKPLKGVRVLDLGAGEGSWSVILAEQGAQLTSLEISPMQVALARERMRIHNLSWDARVGSAYDLCETFPHGSYDLIFGLAVLHHLTQDLQRVYLSISSLLREGGYAVFSEPFAGSPFLRSLRERLSWILPLDRESPDERPLNPAEIVLLNKYFSRVELDRSDFLAKFARRIFRSSDLERILSRLDRRLLQKKRWGHLAGGIFIAAKK